MNPGYSLGSIIVRLKADSTQLNAELAGASSKVGAFGASLTKLAVPILAATGYAAKMAVSFQQQMTYVRTQAGDTEDNLNKLSDSVLNLAKSSQYGPDELAKGLFHLASLGLRGADAMKALDTAQRLAAVGGATLEETTSAVGAAMVTGIQGTQDLNETAGILNATIGAGNMKMQDLIGALGTGVLPAFKNAGLSLKEFGAALATLTDNGMDASNAATRLRMTIGLIEAPSGTARKALEAIGLTSSSLGVTMQKEGLVPALKLLRDRLLAVYGTTAEGKQKMAEALSLMFGGGRSSSAIETLLDQIPRVQNKLQQIGDQAGGFANAYAQQQETASARIKTAWSTIQADAIQLGGTVLPTLTDAFSKVVNEVDKLFTWFNKLTPAQQSLIEKTILYVAVLGPALKIITSTVGMVGTLTRGFGGLIGGISRAAGFLGFARGGLAMGATEATTAIAGEAGAGGLIAAITGPVGIGVALAGLVGIGVYKWLHAFHKEAKDTTGDLMAFSSETGKTSGVVSLLTLWTNAQSDAQDRVKKNTADIKSLQDQAIPTAQASAKAHQDVADAENNVNNALKIYGSNSPQYQKAVQDLSAKQDDLNQKLLTGIGNALDLTIKTGNLAKADSDLKDAIAQKNGLAYWMDILNGKFSYGIQLAGSLAGGINIGIAPAIHTLQGSIQVLQNNIGGVLQTVRGLQGGVLNVQGARAAGGFVDSMKAYLVGEKGPELFVPKSAGNIIPNDKLGGGGISVYGNINISSPQDADYFFSKINRNNFLATQGVSPK